MSPRQPAPDLPEAPRDQPADEFTRAVHRALSHLYDLAYLQTLSLQPCAPPASSARSSLYTPSLSRSLQQSLLQAVDSLQPMPPRRSHTSRLHDLLRLRYVEVLEIDGVCGRLGISRSEYFRDHRRALAAVCSILSESWTLADKRGGERAGECDARRGAATQPRQATREPSRTLSTNVPALLTSFVGREQEMAEVKRLLGRSRLLTLTGTGGCGKTRLALESARSLLDTSPDAYPDGIWLVQLAPIVEPGLVNHTVAASLGIPERAGEPIVTTVTRHLETRRTLLVLDNCEHLLDACARFSDTLLGSCPDLSILATSRQPLGIDGEVTLRVPSLDSPPTVESQSRQSLLQAVLSHDASRLFLDRARSGLPSFAATPSNASSIAEICRRLDGIPLAIELAASRVRALSPDQIASRLDHDFHLLTSGSRTALPRQQTLRATLDWSYELLSEQERMLLRRLSEFAGGFILEAAEGVCAGEGIEELEVVGLLAQLVDKSLVEADMPEGEGRYHLLEPVRQYAWHRLEESGEADTIQRRHARWLAGYIRQTADDRFGAGEPAWLRRAAPESDNVRAALAWCLDHDPRLGMALAASMGLYWTVRGVKGERRRWVDELLARDPEPSDARVGVLDGSTWEAWDTGDYERAKALATEHLSICLKYAPEEAGWPLTALAAVAHDQGDRALGRSLNEQAVQLARKHGNARCLAWTLICSGCDAWRAGDYPLGRRQLEEALAVLPEMGPIRSGLAHWVLGELACSEGDYARARHELEASVEACRSIWMVPNMGRSLIALGHVSLREGDLEAARRDLATGLRLVAPAAYRPRVSRGLIFLSLLAIREGGASRAVRLLGAAEAVDPYFWHELPPDQIAEVEACLAEAREALGEEGSDHAYAEGKAMTLDQAVEYALQG